MDKKYFLNPSTNIFSTPLPDETLYPNHISATDDRSELFLQWFNFVRQKPWKECTICDFGCNAVRVFLLDKQEQK